MDTEWWGRATMLGEAGVNEKIRNGIKTVTEMGLRTPYDERGLNVGRHEENETTKFFYQIRLLTLLSSDLSVTHNTTSGSYPVLAGQSCLRV
jgi:hypothetical protein